ncbi:SNF2-related protein [Lactobacillus crispatus]|uniref:SNF2-related protein n=1 Tax=Lactobacillus crispatus TaxID=47770 RepID=UPI0007613B69|nr:SNF2-related protein [Lactobacillus crispatus]KWU10150.1 hypothetical protein AEL98_06210 [Lactobacillus crispatus]
MSNFYLPDNADESFFPASKADKINNNVEIIKLVVDLKKNHQQATPEQQAKIATYVGWGGLANDFFNEYDDKYAKQREELKSVVSKKQYNDMKESSLTAYYTNPQVARAMWKKVVNDGLTHGNILDPAMGTGIFQMTMPKQLRNKVDFYGVELDEITGMIAKQLFPDFHIFIKGFQNVKFEEPNFDLVITNVPFGNIRILDDNNKPYLIHDYFLKRSLDLVRNYGEVAIISSIGLMDKREHNILKEIKGYTDFLGGVRLPENAFTKIAGTKVTTDVLFFMKDSEKINEYYQLLNTIAFSDVVKLAIDDRVFINKYFSTHPEQILGRIKVSNFHNGTLTVVNKEDYLPKLDAALANKQHMTSPKEFAQEENYGDKIVVKYSKQQDLPKKIQSLRRYEFGYLNDSVYYHYRDGIRKNAKITSVSYYIDESHHIVGSSDSKSRINEWKKATNEGKDNIYDRFTSNTKATTGNYKGYYKVTDFYFIDYSRTEKSRIKGMVDIKKAYLDVIHIQLNQHYSEAKFQKLLAILNRVYDSFVAKYGVLNSTTNANLFEKDDRYPLIASLEDHKLNAKTGAMDYVKGDAFYKALVSPKIKELTATNAKDALLTSVSQGKGVNFDFMKSIYKGHTTQQIISELGDEILIDPVKYYADKTVDYVIKDKCLSGDVVTKYETVQELISENDHAADWKHYKDLLAEVLPKPLAISDISFQFSSSWIPDDMLTKFIFDNFTEKDQNKEDLPDNAIEHSADGIRHISIEAMGYTVYSVESNKYRVQRDGQSVAGYTNAIQILENMLNSKQPEITMTTGYDEHGHAIKEVDDVATAELREVEEKLQKKFKKFILDDVDLSKEIENIYNSKYNRWVNRKYDGNRLFVNGLAKSYHLRDYQANAVQRIIEDKRCLLALEVGTGKTLTMISAGFKLKELGIINRPLYVVPSNLVSQFGQDILKFYPTKNVLVATKEDFQKQNRKRFFARIISSNYDGIVMGQSQFSKLNLSAEYRRDFINDRIEELVAFKAHASGIATVKDIQSSLRSLKSRLDQLKFQQQDQMITFEDLGIDFLFVDEAHNYKNIAPKTSKGRIRGINQTTAKKAMDMLMKVRYIQKHYDCTHIVFATGTPVSNSISEIWTMMDYIQPDVLEKMGIGAFDSFANSFGLIKSVMELNTTGDKYRTVLRFVKFVNLPEIMNIYKRTTDICMASNLKLNLPKAKRFVVKSELTSAQQDKLDELIARTDKIKNGDVDPHKDNMLKVTNEARKLTLDMRLFDSVLYKRSDSDKINQLISNVLRIYYRTAKFKGTQIIFSDLGTPTKKNDFDVYDDIKERLIEKHIPAKEIAFMHDAKNDKQKVQLQRLVNAGDIRILIGSTTKGGTGLNVQRRMKAVHHLDVPWRPADLIQRNGRLVRQGNIFKQVEIYHYITKGSFDNYLWQIQENKLKYITQVMTSNSPIRAMKDIDSETLTASEFKSIATQNPYLKLKMELENKVNLLRNSKKQFMRNFSANINRLEKAKEELPIIEKKIAALKQDLSTHKNLNSLSVTDIRFVDAPHSYSKTSQINQRLRNELFRISNTSSVQDEYETIATFGGYDITARYGEKYNVARLNTFQGFVNATNLYITGAGKYPLQIIFADYSHSNYVLKLKNAIQNLNRKYGFDLRNVEQKYSLYLKFDSTKNKFPDEDKYEYLSAKSITLNDLIERDAEADTIKSALIDFDNEWKKDHPDFEIKKDSNSDTDNSLKFDNDPNDYDDSLFDFAKEILHPNDKKNKSVSIPKPKSNGHVVKLATNDTESKVFKAEQLSFFDEDSFKSSEHVKIEKKVEKVNVASQLTLF